MTDHLINHSYTVLEIERMRRAIYDLVNPICWHSATGGSRMGGEQPEKQTELHLQTYMLNGTRPEELEALVAERERLATERFRRPAECA